MTIPSRSIKRRRQRTSFYAIPLLIVLEPLLFIGLMLIKLVLFDRLVHVPNMAMNRDDVMTAAGTLALASFWTLWLPPKGRRITLILLNVILTAIIYSDLIYFRYFQDLISIPVLMQAGQVGALGESIDSLLSRVDLWFFADWVLLLPLAVFTFFRIRIRRNAGNQMQLSYLKPNRLRIAIRRLAAGLVVFIIGFMLVYVPVHKAKQSWAAELFTGNWWNLSLYNVTGVLGFHGYDLYRYANEHWLQDSTVTAEQTAEAKQWFETRAAQRKALESDALFGKYKGKNVILLQLEAFQSFVINQRINGAEVTPNINKLLGSSVYFSNFYHQTAQGRTSDADLAANVSLQPLPTGSVFIRYAQHDFDSMPQTLKDHGYTANVFHAYDGGFWNRNMMYDRLGYDTFFSKNAYQIDEPIGWSLGDKSFFKQSVDRMKDEKQPFYSFLISLSSHHPYQLPKSAQTLDVGSFKNTIFGDYLEAVHYVDAAIGSLIDELKAAGLWDQSIFMFYGDHDNSIREWEPFETFLGHPLNETEQFRILKGIPFVVHLPHDERAGNYEQVGGQLDITPTVLHLLGISGADKTMIGTPLITAQPDAQQHQKRIVFRNGAFTDGAVLYLPAEDGLPQHSKCYAFTTGLAVSDPSACTAGATAARLELEASDLVIEHDLVKAIHSP